MRSRHNSLTATQALVISLANSLPESTRDYTLYLDNLFPTIFLAKVLAELEIGIMGTVRVKISGFPKELIQLKTVKQVMK